MLRELLKALMVPTGLIWLALGCSSLIAIRAKEKVFFRMSFILFVTYTFAGNGWFCGLFYNYLEHDYRQISLEQNARYDAIILLGGGSGDAPNGEPQLDAEGDRLMVAARLFHRGFTGVYICTGGDPEQIPGDPRGPADSAAQILKESGIPAERIIGVSGRTTKEEMLAVSELIHQRNWKSVGLITSAWHMKRALRNARRVGLELVPLPADFRSGVPRNDQSSWELQIVPRSGAMNNLDFAFREVIANLIGH